MGKIARGSWQKKMFEKMSSPRGLYSYEIIKEVCVRLDYERKVMQSLNNMIKRAIKEGMVYQPVYVFTDSLGNHNLIYYLRPKNAPDLKYIRMVAISAKKGFQEEAVRMIALIEKEDFGAADELAKEIESKIILDAI
ncbi:hypothetical protein [Thermicanus aegyptius]|uniref:hypothetical protein n=1 Tax=Thermicanus aegyptius TaxID=94009 RepID=UPI000492143B|nr:hypothetical protein [Thermicanus aegyptius]